jgi:ArsR family transcriptional regulator, arsenate/arsenite/antimonite-responsive transcriptional repressor
MEVKEAVHALAALAHEHRLKLYRLLVEAGPAGLSAGVIAQKLKLPASSLTFHLQHLHRAELITQQRNSRQLIYAADFAVMNGLVDYLTENCCTGGATACETNCKPAPGAARKAPRKAAKAAWDISP